MTVSLHCLYPYHLISYFVGIINGINLLLLPTYHQRLLHTRVVQHNLRTVASYYQRIHTNKLGNSRFIMLLTNLVTLKNILSFSHSRT